LEPATPSADSFWQPLRERTEVFFLVLDLAQKEWRMPPREWAMAKAQFAIIFEGRFKLA
jgi:transposase-like protein